MLPSKSPSSTHNDLLQIPGYVPIEGMMIKRLSETKHPNAKLGSETKYLLFQIYYCERSLYSPYEEELQFPRNCNPLSFFSEPNY